MIIHVAPALSFSELERAAALIGCELKNLGNGEFALVPRNHKPLVLIKSGQAERDITAQAEWLAQQASCCGYVDLDELFARAPNQYAHLAEMWRWSHPLPAQSEGEAA